MKYLIFALIFLLLVGAIVAAVVFLRKKQTDDTHANKPSFTPIPPVNKPQSPQVNHQVNEPIPTLDSASTQPNYLQKAQHLIDSQRFDEAEQELKRGLNAKPNNSELTIKLLNLYAMNHQHGDFNALYEKIRTQGDVSTINQADRLKSLVDAEQAAKTETTNTAPTEILLEEELDFGLSLDEPNSDDDLGLIDFGNTESGNDTSTKKLDEDEILSFDDLENQLLDKPTTTKTEENLQVNTNDSLELTLDGLKGIEEEETELTELESGLSINNDSLELDDTSHSNIKDNTLSLDDDTLSFDFDDNTDDKKSNEQPAELNEIESSALLAESDLTSNLSTDNSKDSNELSFDWDIEDDDSSQTHKDNDGDTFSLDDTQVDWGLEEEKTTDQTTPINSKENSAETISTDGDFALNIDNSESVADIDTHQESEFDFKDLQLSNDNNETIDSLEQNNNQDFDFNLDDTNTTDSPKDTDNFDSIQSESLSLNDTTASNNPTVDTTQEPTSQPDNASSNEQVFDDDDTLSQLDALNFDDIYSTETTSKNDGVSDSAPVTNETLNQSNSSTPPTSFSGDFGFVNSLDGAQVTLELAVQYLDLGEYESAKRLLNEVIQHGDSQQQDLAKELLAKAG